MEALIVLALIYGVVVAVPCAVIAGWIFQSRGREYGNGAGIGLLFGPVGVLIAFAVPANPEGVEANALRVGNRKCSECAEIIKIDAKVCRFCGHK